MNQIQLNLDELDLREYLYILQRRWRTVALCFLVVVTMVTFRDLSMQPVYTATTLLEIEPDAPKILNFDDLLQVDSTNDAFYQTQYRLIASRSLARRVIERQNLLEHAEFGAGANREPGFISRGIGFVTSIPSRIASTVRYVLDTSPPEVTAEDVADAEPLEDPRYRGAVSAFLGRLVIEPVRNTRLVEVSWSASDPILAATVTNGVADAYVEMNLEAKYETTENASEFLATQIDRLGAEIAKAETDLQAFGGETGILSLDERQDTVTQALADLSAEFTRAQTDRVQKEAYYEQLRNSDPASVPEVFTNNLVEGLKADYAAMQRQRAEMSRQFTDDWPDMQRLRAQMEDQEARIASEEQRIFDSLVSSANNQYQTALERERQIQGLFEQQRQEAMRLNSNLATYRNLQVEIDSNKNLLESLLERQSETGVSARLQGAQTSSIRVVDEALVPGGPSKPALRRDLILSALLGLMAGIGLAFFQEYLDNTLKNADDVERRIGLPSLGVIPSLEAISANGNQAYALGYGYLDDGANEKITTSTAPELISVEHPRSSIADAYRSLRTSVLLSNADAAPKVLIVSSSVPGEGKTTSAVNLAISLAQAGKKVLLMDADMRRPRVHRVLKLSASSGLTHFLTGNCSSLKDVIQSTRVKDLWAMPCGPRPPNPAELLSSERLPAMFSRIREAFDVLVVDSPPVLAVVDPLLLVPFSDGMILVARANETPYQLVERAKKRVTEVGGDIIGVVLNGSELSADRYSNYSYGRGVSTGDSGHAAGPN